MTKQDFYKLYSHPDLLSENHVPDLKILCEQYPLFVPARMMLVKALQNAGSLHFQSEMKKTALWVPDVRKYFFYVFPEEKLNEVHFKRDDKYSGNYFDMLRFSDESSDVHENSLKKLAEKLKQARNLISNQPSVKVNKSASSNLPTIDKKEIVVPVIDYFKLDDVDSERNENNLEMKYKNLLHQKKYAEALQTLKELNLINPKKSIYFADQIRFLEKVLNIQNN